MQVVELFFSPGSRYSYLAASQMPRLEAETGCTFDWRPVNGPDIRALRGHEPFAGAPGSGQYDWGYRRRDAEMWAEYYGIPFREPPSHQFDFRLLALAATAARRLGTAAVYGWKICSAVYGSGAWPIDVALCTTVAREVGLPAGEFSAMLADPETDRQLSEAATEAHRRGAFGVPTFFVGGDMVWGNDRIVLVEHLLRRGRRA